MSRLVRFTSWLAVAITALWFIGLTPTPALADDVSTDCPDAVSFSWTGAVNNRWSVAANWETSVSSGCAASAPTTATTPPTAGSDVTLDDEGAGAAFDVNVDTTVPALQSLTISGNGATLKGSALTITDALAFVTGGDGLARTAVISNAVTAGSLSSATGWTETFNGPVVVGGTVQLKTTHATFNGALTAPTINAGDLTLTDTSDNSVLTVTGPLKTTTLTLGRIAHVTISGPITATTDGGVVTMSGVSPVYAGTDLQLIGDAIDPDTRYAVAMLSLLKVTSCPLVTGQMTGIGTGATISDQQVCQSVPPTAPRNLAAQWIDDGVALSWDLPKRYAAADIAGYQVLRSTSVDGPFDDIDDGQLVADTSFVDESADPFGTYYYEVVAVDTTGNIGAASQPVDPDFAAGSGLSMGLKLKYQPMAGLDVPLQALITNGDDTSVPGPVTATLTFPNTDFQTLQVVSESGDGWTCGTPASLGPLTILSCTNPADIAAHATYPRLTVDVHVPEDAAQGNAPIGYSLATGDPDITITSPSPTDFVIAPPAHAHLTASVDAPPTLQSQFPADDDTPPQTLVVSVANDGQANTASPATITMPIPAGVTLGDSTTAGWTCSADGSTLTCAGKGIVRAGGEATTLALPLIGEERPAGSAPYDFLVTASSTDLFGPVSATANGSSAAPVKVVPVLSAVPTTLDADDFDATQTLTPVIDPSAPGVTGIVAPIAQSALLQIGVDNSGAVATTDPIDLVASVPHDAVVSTTDVADWTCARAGDDVTCSYTGTTPVAAGGTLVGPTLVVSPVSEAPILAAAAFQGSLYSVYDGVSSQPVPTDLSTPGGVVVPPVTTVASVASSPLTSNFATTLTFSLKGDKTAGPAPATTFVLLAPPQVTLDPDDEDITVTDAGAADESDDIAPYPDDAVLPECHVVALDDGATYPGGATTAVVCVSDAPVPAASELDVTVHLTAAEGVAGDLVFETGTVDTDTTVSDDERLDDAQDLLLDQGSGALASSFALHVSGVALTPDAGKAQTVSDVTPTDDGGATPTRVDLDASATGTVGRPLTYAWTQTSGPAVTWNDPAADAVPGSDNSLPAFPDGTTFLGTSGPEPDPEAWGLRPSFSAPEVHDPTTLTFELTVTDGYAVATSTTTVSLTPAADSLPVIGTIRVTDAAGAAISDGSVPAAGSTVQLHVPYSDADNSVIAVTASVAAPSELANLPVSVVTPGSGASSEALLSFAWPRGVTYLQLQVSAADGEVGASGKGIASKASVSVGAVPTKLGIELDDVADAVLPASETEIAADLSNATFNGATTTVTWSQLTGPTGTITPTSDGLSATFTAPVSALPGDTITVQALAVRGSGSNASIASATTVLTVGAPGDLVIDPITVNGDDADAADLGTGDAAEFDASVSGGVAPYSYDWSVASGTDEIDDASVTGDESAGTTSASIAAVGDVGVEIVELVVTDATGATATQDVTVMIGTPPTPVAAACTPTGTLGTIISKAQDAVDGSDPGMHVAVSYGDAVVDLGEAGSLVNSIGNATCSDGMVIGVSDATFTYDGIGITHASIQVSKSSLTIASGTVTLPSSWKLTDVTLQNVVVAFSPFSVSGTLVAHTLPVLTAPAGLSGITTTVTLGDGVVSLSASASYKSAPISIAGAYCLSSTDPCTAVPTALGTVQPRQLAIAVNASGLALFGGSFTGSGVLRVGGASGVSGTVDLAWNQSGTLALADVVSVTSAHVLWDGSTFAVDVTGTIAGHVNATLDVTYADSSNWSATVTGAVPQDWNVADGLTIAAGSGVTGHLAKSAGVLDYDLDVAFSGAWTAGPITVSNVGISLANGADAPQGCKVTTTQTAQTQGSYVQVTGDAAASWSGHAVTVGATFCVIPGVSWRLTTTSTMQNVSLVSGLTLTGVGIVATHTTSPAATNVSLTATGTAAGASGAATVIATSGSDGTQWLADLRVDLGTVNPALSGQGHLIYTTQEIPNLGAVPGLDTGMATTAVGAPASCASPSTPTVAGIKVPAGFSAIGQFTLSQGQCQFLNGDLKLPPTANVAVIASVGGGSVTVTATLNAGTNGITLMTTGDGTKVNMTSASLSISVAPGGTSIALLGAAKLFVPEPDKDATTGAATLSSIDLTAGVAIDLGGAFPAITVSLTKTGADWQNALGIDGLSLGDTAISAGVVFTPIPTPSLGIAATVTDLPAAWKTKLGIQDYDGHMEPVSLALSLSASHPIFALALGVTDSRPFMEPLQPFAPSVADQLKIDSASLYLAPFGGDIGQIHYKPGISLSFNAQVVGTAVAVNASFDPTSATLHADATVGAFTAGPLSMTSTVMTFDTSPTIGVRFHFSGAFRVGAANGSATADVTANTSGLKLALDGTLQNVKLGDVASLSSLHVFADVSIASLGASSNHVSFGAVANATILGTNVVLGGSIGIASSGITSLNLLVATTPISVGPVVIGGAGCDAAAVATLPTAVSSAFGTLPTNGPCLQIAYNASSFALAISGSLTVGGIGASFNGTIDNTGIAISKASIQLTDAFTATVTNTRLYYGSASALNGITAAAPGQAATQVHSGDFRFQGAVAATLLPGFDGSLNVDFGHIGTTGWATGTLALGLFGSASSPVHSNVLLAGDFARTGTTYTWSLDGTGQLQIGGTKQANGTWSGAYTVAAARFHIGSDGKLTVAGTMSLGPVDFALDMRLDWGSSTGVTFYVQGSGHVTLLGVDVGATFTLDNTVQANHAIEATVAVDGSVGSLISFDGGGTFTSTGAFCLHGSANIDSFGTNVTADFCTPNVSGRTAGLTAQASFAGGMVHLTINVLSPTDYWAATRISLPALDVDEESCHKYVGCWGFEFDMTGHVAVSVSTQARDLWPYYYPGTDEAAMKAIPFFGGLLAAVLPFGGTIGKGLAVDAAASFHGEVCAYDCWGGTVNVGIAYNPTRFCGSVKGYGVCYKPPSNFSVD